MRINTWLKNNTERIENQTIAITGSTGGIGKEVCFYLAELGANLIFLNRNEKKSKILIDEIKKKYPKCKIDLIIVDMEDIESVKKAVCELKNLQFNKLIINAGAYNIDRKITSCGVDNIFQINFLSPYYMIRELKECLNKQDNAGVVVVGSIAHNFSKLDTTDIDFSNNKKCSKVYGNAKRFLMFSLYELFKKEKNITLSVCHPGITYTNITSHYPRIINAIIKYPMKIIFISPKKAGLNIIKGVYTKTDYHNWIGPRIFNIWGLPDIKVLSKVTSNESYKIGQIANELYLKLK